MSDTFNDASKIISDATYFDAVLRGLLTQTSQAVDQHIDTSLWNKLFRFMNVSNKIIYPAPYHINESLSTIYSNSGSPIKYLVMT